MPERQRPESPNRANSHDKARARYFAREVSPKEGHTRIFFCSYSYIIPMYNTLVARRLFFPLLLSFQISHLSRDFIQSADADHIVSRYIYIHGAREYYDARAIELPASDNGPGVDCPKTSSLSRSSSSYIALRVYTYLAPLFFLPHLVQAEAWVIIHIAALNCSTRARHCDAWVRADRLAGVYAHRRGYIAFKDITAPFRRLSHCGFVLGRGCERRYGAVDAGVWDCFLASSRAAETNAVRVLYANVSGVVRFYTLLTRILYTMKIRIE